MNEGVTWARTKLDPFGSSRCQYERLLGANVPHVVVGKRQGNRVLILVRRFSHEKLKVGVGIVQFLGHEMDSFEVEGIATSATQRQLRAKSSREEFRRT